MTYDEIRRSASRLRSVPLEAVLRLAGAEPDRHDRAQWHTGQGVLSVTGARFMNWQRGAGGGGAIDLAMHLSGLDFKAAVEWLVRHCPELVRAAPALPRAAQKLRLPAPDRGLLSRVIRYLVAERGLPRPLVCGVVDAGSLYADRRANAVFLLRAEDGAPVGAELRGTGGQRWRGLAPGSRKDVGYFGVGPEAGRTIVLCESAIDAMSRHALHPGERCLSTSGARPNPRWLASLVRPGYRVWCGFDADAAGDEMARGLMGRHRAVERLRPSAHDWNDVLRSRR